METTTGNTLNNYFRKRQQPHAHTHTHTHIHTHSHTHTHTHTQKGTISSKRHHTLTATISFYVIIFYFTRLFNNWLCYDAWIQSGESKLRFIVQNGYPDPDRVKSSEYPGSKFSIPFLSYKLSYRLIIANWFIYSFIYLFTYLSIYLFTHI